MTSSSLMTLLRNRFIRAILISNLFAQFGIWIRNLAVLLYVMEKTQGDAFAVSMISAAEYGPMFLFAFVGGAFADRWRPKRTIVWCESISALSVFIVFLMLASGSWQAVFLSTLCSSIVSQFAQPSGMKLFKLHVREEDAQACISMLQSLFSAFMVAGPILGAIAYRQLGIDFAMLLTGVSFMASAIAMLAIPPDPDRPEATGDNRSSLLREMADGIRYVYDKKLLLLLNLCFLLVGLGIGLLSPLGIFIVTERLGLPANDLPWMTVPYGVGEIAGGIATFALSPKLAPQRLLAIGLLVNSAGILVTGLSESLWLTMLAQLLIALLQPAIFIGNQSLAMRHTEQAFIGRVTGIRTPIMTGSMLLMMSLASIVKNACSLSGAYAIAGFCFLAGMFAVLPLFRASAITEKTQP